MTTRIVSNSELAVWKRCRRKWWLGQHRGLTPKTKSLVGPSQLGTKIHDVLAFYYAIDPDAMPVVEDDGPPSPEEVLALYDRQLPAERAAATVMVRDDYSGEMLPTLDPKTDEAIRKQHDLGHAMLEGYFEWLAETGADSDMEIIGSEREVAVPLTGENLGLARPVTLVGKLDVAIRQRSSGARRFMDHKSVATMGDIPAIADIHEQFLMYSLLDYLEHITRGEKPERAADLFVDGGMFNMLRRVKRTATANPPFYGRHEVRHTVEELRSYWLRIVGEIRDIQRAEDDLAAGLPHHMVVYPNPTRDCSWDCPFRSACPMFENPREDVEAYLAEAYEVQDPYARYIGQKE